MHSYSIITPRGCIDSQNGSDLREQIISMMAEQPQDILIDCKHIEFMDSSGFGCLVAALKRVSQNGKELCLCEISSQLRLILGVAGLDQIIPIFSSMEDCIAHVS